HLLALAALPDMERRRGDVRDHVRAGDREVGGRRAGLPDVLADGRADQGGAAADEHELPARLEVAVLVENPVVREEALVVDALDGAVGADGAGVEEVPVEVREADERRDARGLAGDELEAVLGCMEEARAEEQVLGRIAGDRKLGEEDDVRARLAGLVEPAEDAPAVSVEVA